MAVDASGDQGGFPEVGGGEEGYDVLEKLVGKGLELDAKSAYVRAMPEGIQQLFSSC